MDIFQLLFNGLAVGSIIALAAIGLTLTLGILRISNFAHGDLMTLGGYLAFFFNSLGLNLWLAILIGALATVLLILISEFLIWQPMRERKASSTTLTVISIGLALFIRNSILLFWGGNNQRYNIPLMQAISLGNLKIEASRVLVIFLALAIVVALHFMLQKTKMGKAMRAVADNIDLAGVSGINVKAVILWTWLCTGIITAFSGSLYGLIVGALRPDMGWFLIMPIFAAVILGGIGNPYGAVAGGIIIGIAQEVSIIWLGSNYKLAVALVIMIVILLFRPQGLFKGA
ncbi:MAG: branched-chain amino acid ABC transporter permease [Cyanobacteriota bacterium ELA615]